MKKLVALIATVVGIAAFSVMADVTNITTKTLVRYDAIPVTNGWRYVFSGEPAITNIEITQIHDIWVNGTGLVKSTNVVYHYDGYPTTNKVYDIYYRNVPIYYPVVVTNIVAR